MIKHPLKHIQHETVSKEYQVLEKEKLRSTLLKQIEVKTKKQNKKIRLLEEKLKECASWRKVQHEGDILKAHFGEIKRGATSISLLDWELDQEIIIPLDPKKTTQEELSSRFKKARKLQRGIHHLTKQLEQSHQEMLALQEKQRHLETAEDLEEFKIVETKSPAAKRIAPEKSLPYKEFISKAGVKIWVGKNAKANDKLTFTYASGSDWWLHVQGYSGSHVIIKTDKGHEPDPETLQEAMQLALTYSKAKERGEAEICITQRKYLTRLPRHPGMVQVSQHKTSYVKNLEFGIRKNEQKKH